jgi:hypothetical protein
VKKRKLSVLGWQETEQTNLEQGQVVVAVAWLASKFSYYEKATLLLLLHLLPRTPPDQILLQRAMIVNSSLLLHAKHWIEKVLWLRRGKAVVV